VIMDDAQAATAAVQAESGFSFFGKDLKIAYALENSDRIAKRDGTYVPKNKRKKAEKKQEEQQQEQDTPAPPPPETDAESSSAPPPPPSENPSHILFAEELPSECNEMMLAMLFRQYGGFKEVRIPRPGLAFVEFETESHATLAYDALNGFKLTTTDNLKLSYGKA
jgi:U2 small nuclear ribonucleoprotein B''